MRRLLLNGSPRGKEGNSRKILTWIAEGMAEVGIEAPPMVDLAPDPARPAHREAFLAADEIVFAFPLYIDTMPAIVKTFLELLAATDATGLRGKRVAFIIHSSFPEGVHTEVLGQYLARLCVRLGFQHLGTLRRGESEAIRAMPTDQLTKTVLAFRAAGKALGEKGEFPPELISRMAEPRTFGLVARTVLRLLGATGVINHYWNANLKKNGAFARRFDAPYGAKA